MRVHNHAGRGRVLVLWTGLLAAMLLLESCYGAYPASPGIPTNLVASSDKGDRITLAWDASSDAGVYRIYRSSEGELTELVGATNYTQYIDRDVEAEREYTYTVSALNLYGQLESAPSNPATGSTYGYTWTAPAALASGVLHFDLAAGNGSVYAVWTVEGGGVLLSRWDSDQKAWLEFSSPGAWSGSPSVTLALRGRELLCALQTADGVSVFAYDGTDKIWELVGKAGFDTTPPAAGVRLHLAADNSYTWLGYDGDSDGDGTGNAGTPELWRYASVGGWAAIPMKTLLEPDATIPLAARVEGLALLSGVPALLLESGPVAQRGLAAWRFENEWRHSAFAPGFAASTSGFEVSVLPQGAVLYTAVRANDSARVHMVLLDQGVWTELSTAGSTTGFPAGSATPVVLFHRQEPHLVHDKTDGAVMARRYKDEAWYFAGANSGDTGQSAVESLKAASLGDRLFLAGLRSGILSVSIYQ